jgi:hypothetical protein
VGAGARAGGLGAEVGGWGWVRCGMMDWMAVGDWMVAGDVDCGGGVIAAVVWIAEGFWGCRLKIGRAFWVSQVKDRGACRFSLFRFPDENEFA